MKKSLLAVLGLVLVAGCLVANENGHGSLSPTEATTATPAAEPATTSQVTADLDAEPADAFPQMTNPLVGTIATNYPPIVAEAYGKVDLDDGVDGDEATILAEAYFMGYVTGNGMIGEIADRGDAWEFETFVEYSRTPYNPIKVFKKNGQIICGGGPMVNPPPGPQG